MINHKKFTKHEQRSKAGPDNKFKNSCCDQSGKFPQQDQRPQAGPANMEKVIFKTIEAVLQNTFSFRKFNNQNSINL